MFTERDRKIAAFAVALLGGGLYPANDLIAAANSVSIEVVGAITPSCTSRITAINVVAVDIAKAGSATLSFALDCNTPFQYSLQSDNGALRLVDAPTSALAKTETPYDVHLKIPLSFGGAIDDTCASATLKQGAISCLFSDSGQKIAVNQTAEMKIIWRNPQEQLMPGQYTDRLSISVSARL
jgi:hypothetical protein